VSIKKDKNNEVKMLKYLVLIFTVSIVAQEIDTDKYYEFIEKNKNMSYDDLLQMYPAGKFAEINTTNYLQSNYFSDYEKAFTPTQGELDLIEKNGFVVTERKSYSNFVQAYYDVWINDLPVYFSTDAVLQAWHHSYDKIMMDVESNLLVPMMQEVLDKISDELNNNYQEPVNKVFDAAVEDAKLYIQVADFLLRGAQPSQSYPEKLNNILTDCYDEEMKGIMLFGSERMYDFSQMKPRSRYTRSEKLSQYFRSMMWIGRSEILLGLPDDVGEFELGWNAEEVESRQALVAALISKSAKNNDALSILNQIDNLLIAMLGSQDNINFNHIINALDNLNINNLVELSENTRTKEFLYELAKNESFNPIYSSEFRYTPEDPSESSTPNSSFKLLGQRPILDGFVTASVVYDNIISSDGKVKRMLPSSLDVLFSLGNDAAIQLLDKEFEKYSYATNLTACRYLIENFDNDYWEENLYAAWLNSLRTLNPKVESDREALPDFMQTAGWQQKTMTTQLASWAQLRHDFLLYAKQSYTAAVGCKFPEFFVEPVPEFFRSTGVLVKTVKSALKELDSTIINDSDPYFINNIDNYFDGFISTMQKLDTLAQKELNNEQFTDDEMLWAKCLISASSPVGCGGPNVVFDGWYPQMYYNTIVDEEWFGKSEDKFNVADIHTSPTDESGNMVGWVLHVGTGPVNMATISTKNDKGIKTIFNGPVFSYYEFVSSEFDRVNNDEWMVQFLENDLIREEYDLFGAKPSFSKYYMADRKGNNYSIWDKLDTYPGILKSVEIDPIFKLKAYPNPFTNQISLQLQDANNYNSKLEITDLSGNILLTKNYETIPNNNAIINLDLSEYNLSKGIYLVKFTNGSDSQTIKIIKN
jgi:hypothetical protein